MEEKLRRHNEIISLLSQVPCQSQSEVVRHLLVRGFEVTQASVSRDFRELGIAKISGEYVLPMSRGISIASLVHSAAEAGPNLLVLKTEVGAANLLALQIDRAELSGVLGTLAGDDTVFVATKDKAAQGHFVSSCGIAGLGDAD